MRFTFARRSVALSAALLSALAVVAAGASSAGATSGSAPTVAPVWSTIQPYQTATTIGSTFPPVTVMVSVTCPSYGDCVAAGIQEDSSTSASTPLIAVESNGQWSTPVAAPLPGNAQAGSGTLTSVSCSSASSCVAVGAYTTASLGQQALAVPFTVSGSSASFGTPEQVTLPSGALTTSSQKAFLTSVSCAATCTAVGTYEDGSSVYTAMTATQAAGGAWSATTVPVPSGATQDTVLNAISCPSSGACEAVGSYGDGSGHLQQWTTQVSGGVAGTSEDVTVPGTGTISASTPQVNSGFFTSGTGLVGVSCPSAGVCTTIGDFVSASLSAPEALAAPITQGTVGLFTLVGSPGAYATGLSCWDAGDCVAAGLEEGAYPIPTTTSEIGGSWSAAVNLQNGPLPAGTTVAVAEPESISCSSADMCVTTGLAASETGSGPPAGTVSEGSFFAYSATPLSITTTSLPAAKVGVPYTATLASSGGASTSSWSVTAGSLPAGLSLDASTGVISGTPTATGQSGFIVTATNAGPPSLSSDVGLSITVNPAAVTAAAPPSPTPTPTPSVAIAYLSTSGHKLVLVLSCSGAACKGKLALTGVEHLKGKTVTGVAASAGHKSKRPRTKKITLARGSYSLQAGHTQVRTLKLSKSTVRLLRKLHRIHGELTLTPTGAKKAAIIRMLTFKA